MTPRSRKPVMLGTIFGSSDDQKGFHGNFSNVMEDENSMNEDSNQPQYEQFVNSETSSESSEPTTLRSKSENDISSANDNGLPSPSTSSITAPLSNAFLKYLDRRSLVTEENSVDDSSFCSQPNDYNSSIEENENSDGNKENHSSSEEYDKLINLSESDMSESMLYCLNGNELNTSQSPNSRKRPMLEQNDSEIAKKIMAISATETNL